MKVQLIPSIYNKRHVSFSAGKDVKVKAESKDSFVKDDVQHNFTYEKYIPAKTKMKQLMKGEGIIEGVSYGKEYSLKIENSKLMTKLTGEIGGEPVNIVSQRRKNNGNKFDIEGYVGDKKVSLVEKNGIIVNKKFTGSFGDEAISIRIQHFRNDDLITGDGVNMQLMYYANPKSKPKYVGTYQLPPEFLPVLAGLTRYM